MMKKGQSCIVRMPVRGLPRRRFRWWRGGAWSATKGMLRIVVAPAHCYVPPGMAQGERVWGLALQLYALRSRTNWGVGDFTDLARLVEWAGRELGAGIIGLNPLHALKNSRPHHLSPYSPTSRLFLNELYIDLDRLPEYHASPEAQRLRQSPEFHAGVEQARAADFVDSESVIKAKRTMLDLAYRQFLTENYAGTEPSLQPTSARGWLLERFIRDEGESLERFALFQVLEEDRRLIEQAPKLCGPNGRHNTGTPVPRRYGNLRGVIANGSGFFSMCSGWRRINSGRPTLARCRCT
ncbi:MAG: hypothetical protein DYH03_03585 [Nitrospira sp. NTP1]|nr:hypothetical protein [Nitrospira sp. NTP1]